MTIFNSDNDDPADNNPTDNSPTDKNLTDNNPTDKNLTDNNPTDKNLTDKNLTDKNPTDKAPTQEWELSENKASTDKALNDEAFDGQSITDTPPAPLSEDNTEENDGNGVVVVAEIADEQDRLKTMLDEALSEVNGDDTSDDYEANFIDDSIRGRSAKIPEKLNIESNDTFIWIQSAVGAILGIAVGFLLCVLIYYGYFGLTELFCTLAFAASMLLSSAIYSMGRIISGVLIGGKFFYLRILGFFVRSRGGKLKFSRVGGSPRSLKFFHGRRVAIAPPEGSVPCSACVAFYCGGIVGNVASALILILLSLIFGGDLSRILMSAAVAALCHAAFNFVPRFNGCAPCDGLIMLALLTGSPDSADMMTLDSVDAALAAGQRPSELRIPEISPYTIEYLLTADTEIRQSIVEQAGQIQLDVTRTGGGFGLNARKFIDRLEKSALSTISRIKTSKATIFDKSETDKPEAEPTAADTGKAETEPIAADTDKAETEPIAAGTDKAETEPSTADIDKTETEPITADIEKAETKSIAADISKTETEPSTADIYKTETEPLTADIYKTETNPLITDTDKAETEPSTVDTDKAETDPASSENVPLMNTRSVSRSEPADYLCLRVPLKDDSYDEDGSLYHMLLCACQFYHTLDNSKKLDANLPESLECETAARELENGFERLPGMFKERIAAELCAFYSFYGNAEAAKDFFEVSLSYPNEHKTLTSLRTRAYYSYFIKRNSSETLKICETAISALNNCNQQKFLPYAGCLRMEIDLIDYIKALASEEGKGGL